MDNKLDSFVDSTFGGSNLLVINSVLGLALIVVGIILLVRKKAEAKSKKTTGVICIVVGIGIVLSGIAQSLPIIGAIS